MVQSYGILLPAKSSLVLSASVVSGPDSLWEKQSNLASALTTIFGPRICLALRLWMSCLVIERATRTPAARSMKMPGERSTLGYSQPGSDEKRFKTVREVEHGSELVWHDTLHLLFKSKQAHQFHCYSLHSSQFMRETSCVDDLLIYVSSVSDATFTALPNVPNAPLSPSSILASSTIS